MRRRGRGANGGVALWAGRRARGRGRAEAGRRRDPRKENGGLGAPADAHLGRGPLPSPGMSSFTRGPVARAAHGKPTSVAFLR